MPLIRVGQRFSCLELLPVTWRVSAAEERSEDAILLTIWAEGGEFHVESAAPEGVAIRVELPHAKVIGIVQKCVPDEHYGYILEVTMASRRDWFESGYRPTYLETGSEAPNVQTRTEASGFHTGCDASKFPKAS